MKKTLMVLTFALCATFAFAQMQRTQTTNGVVYNASRTTAVDATESHAGYNGSIFTKDGELFSCEFAVNESNLYSCGTVGAGEMVNGAEIPQHTYPALHGQWHRMDDTSYATLTNSTNSSMYPVFTTTSFVLWMSQIEWATPDNGFMLMTMIDNYAAWGGTGQSGNFDAYIAFNGFSTVGTPMIRVRFYQFYRCFNNDKCFVDYSVDNTNWSAVEINVRGVDVASNGNLYGWKTTTLPSSLGNQANVYLRLRYMDDTGNGGYFWALDDFSVLTVDDYSMNISKNEYFDFYQLLPQGFQVPVVWNVDFVNDGMQAQNNVVGNLYAWMDGDAQNTTVASVNLGTVSSEQDTSILVDPLGLYAEGGVSYTDAVPGPGGLCYLPTSELGAGHWYGDITTHHFAHAYDSVTFDTLRYTVNSDPSYQNGKYVWGRDHGCVRKFSYYAAGLVGESTFSQDYDETLWNEAGYGVTVGYATGATVPQGWRILGVELVPATRDGMRSVGARINPVIWWDSVYGDYVAFKNIDGGGSTYTVQAGDLISGNLFTNLTYAEYGNYPTIFIPFPNQPELVPQRMYHIGYQLVEEANFAVATNGNYYYSLEDSTSVWFGENDDTKDYARANTIQNRFSVAVMDPYDGGIHWFSTSAYPMIRMVVGPAYETVKYGITFDCDGEQGDFVSASTLEALCGTTDSINEGATVTYYLMPAEHPQADEGYIYTIGTILLDGVALDEDEYTIATDDDGSDYAIITLSDVRANHTLSCTFNVGIDAIDGANMKLQPNPATTNVNIVLNGVTGNVSMALIDMSGRVVTTKTFNAEAGASIDVSNLAKGAYFVRIVSDKFSKVEKLIVR